MAPSISTSRLFFTCGTSTRCCYCVVQSPVSYSLLCAQASVCEQGTSYALAYCWGRGICGYTQCLRHAHQGCEHSCFHAHCCPSVSFPSYFFFSLACLLDLLCTGEGGKCEKLSSVLVPQGYHRMGCVSCAACKWALVYAHAAPHCD